MILLIILVVLVILFFGGRGSYGSHPYYNGGFGLLGTILIICLILWLLGVIHI